MPIYYTNEMISGSTKESLGETLNEVETINQAARIQLDAVFQAFPESRELAQAAYKAWVASGRV